MNSIPQNEVIDKLPVAELQADLDQFLQPVLRRLPEKRLRAVGKLAVQGVLGSQSPLLTRMARGVVHEEETIWPAAKRFYRFVWNKRFSHRDLLKGLYGIAQRTVAEHAPPYLVVALDPVNFEKPYTEELEGVSTVMKSTPPPPKGQKKRLTPGYPAITATVVNLTEPVLTYANWFSYVTADFVRTERSIAPFASPALCFLTSGCASSGMRAWMTRRSSTTWRWYMPTLPSGPATIAR
jgi:hypothetical protein